MNSSDCDRSSHVSEEVVSRGKWLIFKNIKFRNHTGEHIWEGVDRTTRETNGSDIDAVEILGIIKYPKTNKETEILLVRQYRPPSRGYSIEMPAGLVDKGEGPKEAALRELKEETGYIAISDSVEVLDPVVWGTPCLSGSKSRFVMLEIDGDDDINKNPISATEECEDISVFKVPLKTLNEFLIERGSKGDNVESKIFSLGLGLMVASKYINK